MKQVTKACSNLTSSSLVEKIKNELKKSDAKFHDLLFLFHSSLLNNSFSRIARIFSQQDIVEIIMMGLFSRSCDELEVLSSVSFGLGVGLRGFCYVEVLSGRVNRISPLKNYFLDFEYIYIFAPI